jgi:hypothetical protein
MKREHSVGRRVLHSLMSQGILLYLPHPWTKVRSKDLDFSWEGKVEQVCPNSAKMAQTWSFADAYNEDNTHFETV